jgi:transposase InsO family protein
MINTTIYLLKHKSEAFEKFQHLKKQVETQTHKKIKILWSDNGSEYKSNDFFKKLSRSWDNKTIYYSL